MPYDYNCADCGHDIDEHFNYELEERCRCLSCWESYPVPCKECGCPLYVSERSKKEGITETPREPGELLFTDCSDREGK